MKAAVIHQSGATPAVEDVDACPERTEGFFVRNTARRQWFYRLFKKDIGLKIAHGAAFPPKLVAMTLRKTLPARTALAALLLCSACAAPRTARTSLENTPAGSAVKELKNYPAARTGYHRAVIYLPEKSRAQEGDYKVELVAGKTAPVDCNLHHLTGTLNRREVAGFGYDYYELQSTGDMTATRMACPDAKKTEKFVSGPAVLLPYNSRLPLVVDMPAGYELKYRIWNASALQSVR